MNAMNLHRDDFEKFEYSEPNLGNLPYDLFYSNEYNYITLPEVQVLFALTDSSTSYTFSGLRKRTQLHQYKISKSLKRLQERDLIDKEQDGTYSLTAKGEEFSRKLIKELLKRKDISYPKYNNFQIQRVKLFAKRNLDQKYIKKKLYGRWFGDFRFLYAKEDEKSLKLCWEDTENWQIILENTINNQLYIQFNLKDYEKTKIDNFTNWLSKELLTEVDIPAYSLNQKSEVYN
ncbi:MAG: MarR family transcriptional regulator [Candidatus Heimdallarchaeaceae archaeon]